MQRLLAAAIYIILLCCPAIAADDIANWISVQPEDAPSAQAVVYSIVFPIDFDVREASLKFTCYTPPDLGTTQFRGFVNSAVGPKGTCWRDALYMNISKVLKTGDNQIDIEVTWTKNGVPGPILAKLVAKGVGKDGSEKSVVIRTDASWSYSVGEYDAAKTRTRKSAVVIAAADAWELAKSPVVLPKMKTSDISGVTSAVIKAGYLGSTDPFGDVRNFGDKLDFLRSIGCSVIAGKIYPQVCYQYPGVWFWGYDKETARQLNAFDMAYEACPRAWDMPEWYRNESQPQMMQCIEHGQDGSAVSMWSPALGAFEEKFYGELQSGIGGWISSVNIGTYGETDSGHSHPGFWAADPSARSEYQAKLNADYPKLDGSDSRRLVLDFLNWYTDAFTRRASQALSIAKNHFVSVPASIKINCADENPMAGQDISALVKLAAAQGAAVSAICGHGSYIAARHVATACALYGVPLDYEIAGVPDKRDYFDAAGSGCASILADPNALMATSDVFSESRRHIRAEKSLTEIALLFPTSAHRANLRVPYPARLSAIADEVRDVFDYDIIDERMALDGALDKYKSLAILDGDFAPQAVYDKIIDWVNRGGTLILCADQLPYKNVDGEAQSISSLAEEAKTDGAAMELGSGQVLVWSDDWAERDDLYSLIYESTYPNSTSGVPESVDGMRDGVITSLYKDRVIYLNTTDAPVTISEEISSKVAFRLGLAFSPSHLRYSLEIPAGKSLCRYLDRPTVEFSLNCEGMTYPKDASTKVINRGGVGTPGIAVQLKSAGVISGNFTVPEDADYAVCCMVDPAGEDSAELIIDDKPLGKIPGLSGAHKFMYPICARVRLARGKHSISMKFKEGDNMADRIVFTTDTSLAGFTYAYSDPKVDTTW